MTLWQQILVHMYILTASDSPLKRKRMKIKSNQEMHMLGIFFFFFFFWHVLCYVQIRLFSLNPRKRKESPLNVQEPTLTDLPCLVSMIP